ncbi:AraC family transcriptional regulator [Tardiphaga alba]
MLMGGTVSVSDGAAPARLAAFSRVCTTDVDEAADEIGRIFCPHGLAPTGRSDPGFHAHHNSADFGEFSINYVSYGGSVSIDPGCLDRFFLLQVPLRGHARVSTGGRTVAASAARAASLLSPTMPTRMVWQDDCAQLILLLERRVVEQRAAALAERADGVIEFDPEVDLTTPFGRALRAQLDYLVDLAEHAGPEQAFSPTLTAMLREAALSLLLTGQRHSFTDAIAQVDHRPAPLPGVIRKARHYLEAHATEPLDLERLARAAGIGIRSLQLGFQRHFGTSISQMLQDIRLAHLHARLRDAQPCERVTDIAFDLGFTHPSRMASAYRARFGESPSDTLRRGG